jgi:hypothetical protein
VAVSKILPLSAFVVAILCLLYLLLFSILSSTPHIVLIALAIPAAAGQQCCSVEMATAASASGYGANYILTF